jgi:hypothetical protein
MKRIEPGGDFLSTLIGEPAFAIEKKCRETENRMTVGQF